MLRLPASIFAVLLLHQLAVCKCLLSSEFQNPVVSEKHSFGFGLQGVVDEPVESVASILTQQ